MTAPDARKALDTLDCEKCGQPKRCARCNTRPRGKMAIRNFERYEPYCTYQCREYARMDAPYAYLAELRCNGGQA